MSNPNFAHDPYVVVRAPGGETIALAVVGIVVCPHLVLLYALATILLLTVATEFTPPSNIRFLVPGIATQERRFVSLE